MKLTLKMKKRLFQKATCVLVVNGAVVATLTAGGVETIEIAERERYYVTLADKAYGAISVLIPEGDAMTLMVDRRQRAYSLDIEGGRLETLSLARLFSAMYDEGQLLNLVPWEKNAFYGLLYLELYQKDAVLESSYVLEMRDALEVGDEVTTIGGIIGKVVSIKEQTFVLETTKDKTKIRFLKGAIRTVDVKASDLAAQVIDAAKAEAAANEAPAADDVKEIESDKKAANK
jgi:preprotein translocase subunit YajC